MLRGLAEALADRGDELSTHAKGLGAQHDRESNLGTVRGRDRNGLHEANVAACSGAENVVGNSAYRDNLNGGL